jgi:hypothetical protein
MLRVEASTFVRAPVDRVKEVVLDPVSYTAADTKVDRIDIEERTAEGMVARILGHFGPIRSTMRARYTIRDDRIDLDMIEGRLRAFHAAFLLSPADGVTLLTHCEEYDFGYPLVTPLVELMLARWAQRGVVQEVEALRQAAEPSL